jgi:hypothetical protein
LYLVAVIAGHFGFLAKDHEGNSWFGVGGVLQILGWTVIGILGSYSVVEKTPVKPVVEEELDLVD